MRDELYHSGKKGMKWGYNDGVRNGKRTADTTQASVSSKFGDWAREQLKDTSLLESAVRANKIDKTYKSASNLTSLGKSFVSSAVSNKFAKTSITSSGKFLGSYTTWGVGKTSASNNYTINVGRLDVSIRKAKDWITSKFK